MTAQGRRPATEAERADEYLAAVRARHAAADAYSRAMTRYQADLSELTHAAVMEARDAWRKAEARADRAGAKS